MSRVSASAGERRLSETYPKQVTKTAGKRVVNYRLEFPATAKEVRVKTNLKPLFTIAVLFGLLYFLRDGEVQEQRYV